MTVFCPNCKDMSVTYVHALKTAQCMNIGVCSFQRKFDSWEECKKGLFDELVVFAQGQGMKIAPWNKQPIQTNMSDLDLADVTEIAKELHAVFVEASKDSELLDEDNVGSFYDNPESIQNVLVQLACFVSNNFERKKNGCS